MTMAHKNVDYSCQGQTHNAYFSWDDTVDHARPGVILIHEWWGLNDYIRMRADQVAELGYCALAIDMYGSGEIAAQPDRAGELMQSVTSNMSLAEERLRCGYQALLNESLVDHAKTAAMGYCFGGAMALHMARIGLPLNAVATFHAALPSFAETKAGDVQADILVCHGNDDAMVSAEDLASFEKDMARLSVSCEVQRYDNVGHGFTNPEADNNREKFGVPLAYNQAADASSWIAMQNLYARAFV